MNEQVKDQGAVVGYRPDIKYSKSPRRQNQGRVNSTNEVNVNDSPYSSTITSFIDNTPSSSLTSIQDSISRIDTAINRMANIFKEQEYSEFGNIDLFLSGSESDLEYTKNFLDYHYNNINGSSVPEIVSFLQSEKKKLLELQETLKKLYYGNSKISEEKAMEIDNNYISLITSKEINKEQNAINYLVIANDTKLNKVIKAYTSKLNSSAIDLEDVLYRPVNSSINSSTGAINTIKTMFSQNNPTLDDKRNIYNSQQNIETMNKTLYNYYGKRMALKEFYDTFYNLGEDFLNNKLIVYKEELSNSITNVTKSILSSAAFLESIQPIEAEKQYLRSVYNTINYNS